MGKGLARGSGGFGMARRRCKINRGLGIGHDLVVERYWGYALNLLDADLVDTVSSGIG
jgi:hypothetical protein